MLERFTRSGALQKENVYPSVHTAEIHHIYHNTTFLVSVSNDMKRLVMN